MKKKTKKTTTKTKTKKNSASKAVKKSEGDIITLILADHKPLKQLIKVMKSEAEFDEKSEAFEQFAPLLINHAKPEEQSLYVFMKKDEELRQEGLEGDTEHAIADSLIEEIKATEDEDAFCAKVKVLAELVEHHIEEEEEDMLPDFRKNSETEERVRLGEKYLKLKNMMSQKGSEGEAPSEEAAEAYVNQ